MSVHVPAQQPVPPTGTDGAQRAIRRQRWLLLARFHRALDPVFVALSAIWIGLVVVELAGVILPRSLEIMVWIIWGLFVAEFAVGLLIAPSRGAYVRKRWLTAVSLLLPALRVIRIASLIRLLGASRLARSVGLLRVLTSVNRGLGALGRTARRRGLGYVVGATAIIILVGSAGMAYFETPAVLSGTQLPAADRSGGGGEGAEGSALGAFSDALWWTAYAMTTGATSQPRTGEGRLLGWLLSVYGLVVFGYLTAILASHFVERDRREGLKGLASSKGPV